MQKSWLAALALTTLALSPVRGQDAPLDLVVYRSWLPPNITVVEGVFRVDPQVVGTACEYRAQVTVRDAAGRTLKSDDWNGRCPRTAEGPAAGLEKVQFALVPASYTLEVTVDGTASGGGKASTRREIAGFAEPPLMSDLILAREVAFDSTRVWPLTRGKIGIDVASRIVAGPDDWDLDYYVEVYPPAGSELTGTVSGVVRRPDGRELARVPLRQLDRLGQAFPVAGKMSVAGLAPGEYTFELVLVTVDSTIVRPHRFEVASAVAAATQDLSGYFASLSDEELLRLFNPIQILLRTAEGDMYRDLSTAGKRNFLAQQFAGSDPQDENSALGTFLKRSRHVTENLAERAGRNAEIPAWQTDRGRIWMLKGEPTSNARRLTPKAGSPYEIWVYAGQSPFVYLFADETRLGNYRLIYTTDPTETTLANWTRRIGPEAIEDMRRLGVRVTAPDKS